MQIQILISGLPVEGTAYRAGEGVIIHIPDIAQKVGEEPGMLPPFSALFRPVSSGFIEVGEWSGKAYEFEGGVELVQGPDGRSGRRSANSRTCRPPNRRPGRWPARSAGAAA